MQQPWPVQFELLVDHVYDGDTIMGTILADAGLGMAVSLSGWSLRMYAINAPELFSTGGAASRGYLRSLVSPGDRLAVTSYGFDKYGRRVDGVPFTIAGVDLCQAMLDAGMAVPYSA